jgi:hypothetical protein
MPGSAIPKPLAKLVAWVDRWITAAGRSCCVGRAQAELRDTIDADADSDSHEVVGERS